MNKKTFFLKFKSWSSPSSFLRHESEKKQRNMVFTKAISETPDLNPPPIFLNVPFDKGRLKAFVLWFLKNYGQYKTLLLLEKLKDLGYSSATQAGISLGIDDLKIPPQKANLLFTARKQTHQNKIQYKKAQMTDVEYVQKFIEIWHQTSEILKKEVVKHFEATDLLNPVYMMAFSGARGNLSQVRQLVGMRGLMSDPQGQIIDFPICSNFREGLTLTEYVISTYGARKGIVDTALKTANAGYLTRRLVDVAQHVIVSQFDCCTKKGVFVFEMKEGTKTIYPLKNRLIGRVLAKDIWVQENQKQVKMGSRNQEISSELSEKLVQHATKILIRSPLTCQTRKSVCQLCYGWSLATNRLVSIGEVVGVIAAQSIGEPGTQLTMRTFHTGGVFAGAMSDQVVAQQDGIVEYVGPIAGSCVRTPQGEMAFLTKSEGSMIFKKWKFNSQSQEPTFESIQVFKVPSFSLLFARNGQHVQKKQLIAQLNLASARTNPTGTAEQTVYSNYDGELYFTQVNLLERFHNYDDLNAELLQWGYIWILSGRIYKIPMKSNTFSKAGDWIPKQSQTHRIRWVNPFPCFLEPPANLQRPIHKGLIPTKTAFGFSKMKPSNRFQNSKGLFLEKQQASLSLNPYPMFTKKYLFHDSKKRSSLEMNFQTLLSNSTRSKSTHVNFFRPQNLQVFTSPVFSLKYKTKLLTRFNLSVSKNTFKKEQDSDLQSKSFNGRKKKKPSSLFDDRWFTESYEKLILPNSSFFPKMYKNHRIRILQTDLPIYEISKNSNSLEQVKSKDSVYEIQPKDLDRKISEKNKVFQFSKNIAQKHSWIFLNSKTKRKFRELKNHSQRSLYMNYVLSFHKKKTIQAQIQSIFSKSIGHSFAKNHPISFVFRKKPNPSLTPFLKFGKTFGKSPKVKKIQNIKTIMKPLRFFFCQKQFMFNWSIFYADLKNDRHQMPFKNTGKKWLNSAFEDFSSRDSVMRLNQKASGQIFDLKQSVEKQEPDYFRVLNLKKDVLLLNLKNIQYKKSNYSFSLPMKPFSYRYKNSKRSNLYETNLNARNKPNLDDCKEPLLSFSSFHSKEWSNEKSYQNTYYWRPNNRWILKWFPEANHVNVGSIFFLSSPFFYGGHLKNISKTRSSLLLFSEIQKNFQASNLLTKNLPTLSFFSKMLDLFLYRFKKKHLSSSNKKTNLSKPVEFFHRIQNQKGHDGFFNSDSDLRLTNLEHVKEKSQKRFRFQIKDLKTKSEITSIENCQKKHGQYELYTTYRNRRKNHMSFFRSISKVVRKKSAVERTKYFLNTKQTFKNDQWLSRNQKSLNHFHSQKRLASFEINPPWLKQPFKTQTFFLFYLFNRSKNSQNPFVYTSLNQTQMEKHSLKKLTEGFDWIHPLRKDARKISKVGFRPSFPFSFEPTLKLSVNFHEVFFMDQKTDSLDKQLRKQVSKKTSEGSLSNRQGFQKPCYPSNFGMETTLHKALKWDFPIFSKWRFNPKITSTSSNQKDPTIFFFAMSKFDSKLQSNLILSPHFQIKDLKVKFGKHLLEIKDFKQNQIQKKCKKESLQTKKEKEQMDLKSQYAWVYKPRSAMTFSNHESTFSPGKEIVDQIQFETRSVYVRYSAFENSSTFENFERKNKDLQKQEPWGVFKKIDQVVSNEKCRFFSFYDKNALIPFSFSNKDLKIQRFESEVKKSMKTITLIFLPMQHKILPNSYFYKRKINRSQRHRNEPLFSCLTQTHYHSSLLNKQIQDSNLVSSHPSPDFQVSSALKIPQIYKKFDFKNPVMTGFWNLKKQKKSNFFQKSKEKEQDFFFFSKEANKKTTFYVERRLNSLKSFYFGNQKDEDEKSLKNAFDLKEFGLRKMQASSETISWPFLQSYFSYFPSSFLNLQIEMDFPKNAQYAFKTIGMKLTSETEILSRLKDFNPVKNKPSKFTHLLNRVLFVHTHCLNKEKDFSETLSSMRSNLHEFFVQNVSTPVLNLYLQNSFNYFANQRFASVLFTNQDCKNHSKPCSLKQKESLSKFPTFRNEVFLNGQNAVQANQKFALTTFFSPYEGEMIAMPTNRWLQSSFFEKKDEFLILSKRDCFSVSMRWDSQKSQIQINPQRFLEKLKNVYEGFLQNEKQLNEKYQSNIFQAKETFIHHDNKLYKVKNIQIGSVNPYQNLRVGAFILQGDAISAGYSIQQPGQIIHIGSQKMTVRRGQTISLSPGTLFHFYNGDFVKKSNPVVTLPFQTLKTGDIVQGIPKVEQYFEARTSRAGRVFRDSLPLLLQGLFLRYSSFLPLDQAVKQSVLKIQQIIVDGVQRVYRSQGVGIVDKHLEIIVRQMTSKVQIVNAQQTGFFPGELFDFEFIEYVNSVLQVPIKYEPVILGITRASLEVDSFLSAASFQQTTRILSKAAISRKKDFLNGLKENLITANLIPAGTGYFIYSGESGSLL